MKSQIFYHFLFNYNFVWPTQVDIPKDFLDPLICHSQGYYGDWMEMQDLFSHSCGMSTLLDQPKNQKLKNQ